MFIICSRLLQNELVPLDVVVEPRNFAAIVARGYHSSESRRFAGGSIGKLFLRVKLFFRLLFYRRLTAQSKSDFHAPKRGIPYWFGWFAKSFAVERLHNSRLFVSRAVCARFGLGHPDRNEKKKREKHNSAMQ